MSFLPIKSLIPSGTDEALVCGMDEVGRGPWAGPIVTCALMFTRPIRLPHLKDSKQLSEKERSEFFELLDKGSAYGLGVADCTEVDQLGLLKANNLAFNRAIEQLSLKGHTPAFLIVDGRDRLQLPHPWKTVIKGDEKVKLVACASIMAKVTRDRMMTDYAIKYPEYGFENHKGYGTEEHQKALKMHGACPIHRKSFAPVNRLLQMTIE